MPRQESGFEESEPPELIDLTQLMFPVESEPAPKTTDIPQIPEPKFEAATGPAPIVPEFLPFAVEAVATPTPVSFRDWWNRLMAKMVRPSPANLNLPSMLYPRTAQPAYHPGCTYEGGGRNSVVPARFDAEEADAPPKQPWWKPRRTP